MHNDSKTRTTFDVGYKKPPKTTQFQKGKSGNPKGRPKGSRNLSSLILESARQKVRVRGPRGEKVVTKPEAILMQLSNKAAQGDLAAARMYFSLLQSAGHEEQSISDQRAEPHEMDVAVMKGLATRLRVLDKLSNGVPAANQQEEQI